MFADTDFILALIKDSDWLKERATKVLNTYKGTIKTSISVMIEVALICKRLDINIPEVFVNIFEIIDTDSDSYNVSMRAAIYIDKHGLNVFDAFHAASCFGDTIISSDSAYDTIGMKRLKLESVN